MLIYTNNGAAAMKTRPAKNAADAIFQAAIDAEKKLATIARTRRPTEAETATALKAYAAAAKVQAKFKR